MNHRSILSALALCLGLVTSIAQAVTCAPNMTASNPDADYTDHADGTVTHVPTGLMWKRCAEGQSWNGSTCTGTESGHTWAQALSLSSDSSFAGHGDWRLPNYKELLSLVEECRINPAINDSVFPAASSSFFWSGSPFAYYPDGAWVVYFGVGYAGLDYRSNGGSAVRLVRGGQSFDSLGVIGAPVCTLTASPAAVAGGGTSTLTATCTPAATSYSWTGGTCAGTSSATCTVTPSATTTYTVAGVNAGGTGTAASATVTVAALASQTISFTNPGAQTLGTAPFALTVFGGASGNPVILTSQSATICTVSGKTVTLLAVGTCTLAANQAGNASYAAAAQVVRSFAVNAPTYILTVNSVGAAGVAIASNTGHGDTTPYSKAGLTPGTSVQLTAPASLGATNFSSWTGCDAVENYTCTVSMTAAKTVTANFIQSKYTVSADGTVFDANTGLTWMRCAMGQSWDGSTCTGTAGHFTWEQAKALTGKVIFAGNDAWRLPTARELQTLVDRSRSLPAIDVTAFPATSSSSFWSASAYAVGSGSAWNVDFTSGVANDRYKGYSGQARLVRAGQSAGLLNSARPTTDYVDQGDGTVTHTPTHLTWKRCAQGQTWNGSGCAGTAGTYTWDQANALTGKLPFAGKADWRLPTQEELLSLVDYTKSSPAIHASLFPIAHSSVFWSASADANYSGGAWNVGFTVGNANSGSKSASYQVRLVRAGQPFGTFVLATTKNGSGTVTSAPAAFICGSTCSASFTSGTSVTLTATPDSGNTFTGWSGACTGTGSCTVSMTSIRSVTANFAAATTSLIDHYYANILNREADTYGKNFWQNEVARMGSLGVSQSEVYIVMASNFYTSPEFLARSLSNDQYVQNLYSTFFNRAPAANEVAYWESLISAGLPRDMVMYGFMFSQEFANFMQAQIGSSSQRPEVGAVTDYYRGILGRLPETAGLKYWVNQFRLAQCSSNPTANVYTAATSIATYFFGSLEYTNSTPTPRDYVADLYNAFMRRIAEPGGYYYWIDQITSGLSTKEQARQAFINSPEFAARVQAITAASCTVQLP